ncbi:MAG: SUMF1/EgtB/PvdO family nonheme iron enzyme [Candidatus Eremiobacterota bacterium]
MITKYIYITTVIIILTMFIGCGSDSSVSPPVPVITPTPTATPTAISGPPMVSIPGGTFNMGSTVGTTEQPVHSVTVSSFYMGTHEVTNSHYVLFLNSQGNQTEGGAEWISIGANQYQGITGGPGAGTFSLLSGYENHPVAYVSWYGAVAYCNWLSTQQGLTPCYGPINDRGDDPSVWRTRNGYRLPTEAEWEYACRAGSTADYYWGESSPNPEHIGDYAWYESNSNGNHSIVCQKLPNSFGLYDMSGNMGEWCSDWYSSSTLNPPAYYSVSPGTNPTGPASGSDRVLRGGSWYLGASYCRSAVRYGCDPSGRFYDFGFRPVRN